MSVVPGAPTATSIYRGFLLSPAGNMDLTHAYSTRWQVATSTDNNHFGNWQDFETVYSFSHFNALHNGLYTNVYYMYRYIITYLDGSHTEWSDPVTAGNGIVPAGVDSSVSSLDQIAASLGTINSGFLRGVVFETSPNYPKVRMDPTGFYSIGTTSTPLFINGADGTVTAAGVFRTAPTGTRTELSSNSLRHYDGSNLLRYSADYSGLITYDGTGTISSTWNYGSGINWFTDGAASGAGATISWWTSGGSIRKAFISTYVVSGGYQLDLQTWGNGGTGMTSIAGINGAGVSGNNYSSLGAIWNGTNYQSFTRAGARSKTILRDDGFSEYMLQDTPTTNMRLFSAGSISIGATGPSSQSVTTATFGVNLPASWNMVGYFNQAAGGAFLDWMTWCITGGTANSVNFSFVNQHTSGTASGNFYYYIFGGG